MVALSPWPNAGTKAQEMACATLKESIGANFPLRRVNAIGAAAAALVGRHAPGAPGEIKDEAVVRCAGWLADQPMASVRDETTGDISTSYNTASLSALRHSGAMALLAPWRIYRAGVIE